MLTANYYPWKTNGWALVVLETVTNGRRLDDRKEFVIQGGKREARKLAAEYNATPWNF